MLIYHGSHMKVEIPEIRLPNRNHDFGIGFYATANENQALKYAQIVYNRQGGIPTVSCYEFDCEVAKTTLKIKRFDSADGEWFDFVCDKRMGRYTGVKYDLIYGPVANDKVYLSFTAFLAGTLTRDETLKKLNNNKLYNQFTFCTEIALSFIKFVSSKEVNPL